MTPSAEPLPPGGCLSEGGDGSCFALAAGPGGVCERECLLRVPPCGDCGRAVRADADYCPYCGAR